jgi:hypothetical protein
MERRVDPCERGASIDPSDDDDVAVDDSNAIVIMIIAKVLPEAQTLSDGA